jgi:hypothetical protein
MIHWLGEPLRGRHPFLRTEPVETEYAAFGITPYATASSLFLYPEAPKKPRFWTRLELCYTELCKFYATMRRMHSKVWI